MRTIWKYPLTIIDQQDVLVPYGVKPLCVQTIGTQIWMWCEIPDTKKPQFNMYVHIFGTGNPMRPEMDARYLGTVQTYESELIWHIYVPHQHILDTLS